MALEAGSDAGGAKNNSYRYYDLIMAAFVATLLCSELIGVGKVSQAFGHEYGTGILFFPINFLFGDILTEVYGYARARRVMWMGFGALLFATFMAQVVLAIPAAPSWSHQAELEYVFGATWRIVAATYIAFFVGEMVNAYVLAKLKVATEGRYLWVRTIGSTIAGEGINTVLFYPIAFMGRWSNETLVAVMWADYIIKVGWEAVATPLTYWIVAALKRAEGEDFYDRGTNFTPFRVKV